MKVKIMLQHARECFDFNATLQGDTKFTHTQEHILIKWNWRPTFRLKVHCVKCVYLRFLPVDTITDNPWKTRLFTATPGVEEWNTPALAYCYIQYTSIFCPSVSVSNVQQITIFIRNRQIVCWCNPVYVNQTESAFDRPLCVLPSVIFNLRALALES